MSHDTVETIDISSDLRVRIEIDMDPTSPTEWDNLGEIAYLSKSRYVLGTEGVSEERMDEIGRKVRSGEYIGVPVFAYVHSGSTIRAAEGNPFHCPWDSGRSGWVYCTAEKARQEFAGRRYWRKAARDLLRAEVATFAQYLEGDVYGYIVERVERDEDGDVTSTTELDSCWGLYGLEYARTEGKSAAEAHVTATA